VSSSGRDTNEASPKKQLSGTHSNFKVVVERSRSQRLAAEKQWEWRFNYCKCCQITVRNANNFMLLWYNNSNKHTNSQARLQYARGAKLRLFESLQEALWAFRKLYICFQFSFLLLSVEILRTGTVVA